MDLQSIEERLLRVESILSSERRVRRKLQRENAHFKLEISSLKERLHAAEESIRVLENQPIMSPIIPQGITAAKTQASSSSVVTCSEADEQQAEVMMRSQSLTEKSTNSEWEELAMKRKRGDDLKSPMKRLLRSGSLDRIPSPTTNTKKKPAMSSDASKLRNWWELPPRPFPSPSRFVWELDLREDNTQDATQVGLPLRTRNKKPKIEKQMEDPSPIKDLKDLKKFYKIDT